MEPVFFNDQELTEAERASRELEQSLRECREQLARTKALLTKFDHELGPQES